MGISVLIPTYNRPKLLRRALLSVLNQTRLPDEIVISDDNPDSQENFRAVEDLVTQYSNIIKYVKTSQRLGVVENYRYLLSLASGTYIKFLADDDYLHPETLERMEKVLSEDPEVTLVTSARVPCDLDGHVIEWILSTKPLFDRDVKISGLEVVQKSVDDLRNYVGEFSTYMFRKSDLDIDPFYYKGRLFRANADWILWMYLASKGYIFFFSRPLSVFTIHEQQDQQDTSVFLSGILENIDIAFSKKLVSQFNVKNTKKNLAKRFEIIYSTLNFAMSTRRLRYKEFETAFKRLKSSYEQAVSKIDTSEGVVRKNNGSKLSIIIVTYNSEREIKILLQSLEKSICKDDEIIIVDNSSIDNTVKVINEFLESSVLSDKVKLIGLRKNIGYAAAVNLGVSKSTGEFLVFVNPDTVLPRNWREKVVDALCLEKVGAVSAVSNYVWLHQHISKFSNIYTLPDKKKNINFISFHLSNLYGSNLSSENFLSGFFYATRRKVFDDVGGFDKDLFLGMDDLDYALKLKERGLKLSLIKGLFVYHEGHVSFKKSSKSEFLNKQTMYKFADKLIEKFGYGSVPNPEDVWSKEGEYFSPFVPDKRKYKFMFKFLRPKIDFRTLAKEIYPHPPVAVITVAYFSSSDLALMAESLSKMKYKNFVWFIVDHSESSEEKKKLLELVEDFKERIDIRLFFRENRGYAAGNNFAVGEALKYDFKYIWILNPDITVESTTLSELVKTIVYTGADVVTCKIKDNIEKNKLQYDGMKVSYKPFDDYPQRIFEPVFLSGANFLASRKVFEMEKFNEDYFLYFEDNEFFDSIKKRGFKVLYTPFTWVYHKNKKFLSSPKQIYYFVRNNFLYRRRKSNSFKEALEMARRLYFLNFSNLSMLRVLILAIFHGVIGLKGKVDFESLIKKELKKDFLEALQLYFNWRLVSKRYALEKGLPFFLKKPRDTEKINLFFKDIYYLGKYLD